MKILSMVLFNANSIISITNFLQLQKLSRRVKLKNFYKPGEWSNFM